MLVRPPSPAFACLLRKGHYEVAPSPAFASSNASKATVKSMHNAAPGILCPVMHCLFRKYKILHDSSANNIDEPTVTPASKSEGNLNTLKATESKLGGGTSEPRDGEEGNGSLSAFFDTCFNAAVGASLAVEATAAGRGTVLL